MQFIDLGDESMSWDEFIDHLSSRIASGADSDALASEFSGKTVEWSGVLAEMVLDLVAPAVRIDMLAREVRFSDGSNFLLDAVHVPVAPDACERWRSAAVGTQVTFRATFAITGRAMFPSVSIQSFRSGRSIILLSLSNGVFVE